MKVFYSADYNAAKYQFDTTIKSQWIAKSLKGKPINNVEVIAPTPATRAQIETVHAKKYVQALETGDNLGLAESQGFQWDKGLWTSITASTGGVIAAAQTALTEGTAGSLSSGLHHARKDRGAGFCSINGLAVAAKEMLRTKQAQSVLIVDFDAHCGGGTYSLIRDTARICQIDVSTSDFDSYLGNYRTRLWGVDNAMRYLDTCQEALETYAPDAFDLVIYNAGMDPYEHCHVGGLYGIDTAMIEAREQMVFQYFRDANTPVCFALAGGYINSIPKKQPGAFGQDDLVNLHRMTIKEAAQWQ